MPSSRRGLFSPYGARTAHSPIRRPRVAARAEPGFRCVPFQRPLQPPLAASSRSSACLFFSSWRACASCPSANLLPNSAPSAALLIVPHTAVLTQNYSYARCAASNDAASRGFARWSLCAADACLTGPLEARRAVAPSREVQYGRRRRRRAQARFRSGHAQDRLAAASRGHRLPRYAIEATRANDVTLRS